MTAEEIQGNSLKEIIRGVRISMILVCIVFIVWISVLYSVLRSNDRENKDITGEEYKRTRSRAQVIFKFMINMILIFLLLMALLLLAAMSPVQWANPKQFNENTVDIIRVFSLLGFCVNAVLIWQNKRNKIVFCLVLITNIYMAYKVFRTFFIF